mgnify:CR=1 FL=1
MENQPYEFTAAQPGENIVEQKKCLNCGQWFIITDKDLEFYSKISPIIGGTKYEIPSPTLCPDCRQQRRLATWNEEKMYRRKCSSCGKSMISIYTEYQDIPVYCSSCRWGDKFDPMSLGRDFDFSRSFFEQFNELNLKVPKLSLLNVNSENCEYNHWITNSKNCYLSFWNNNIEDCYYCYASNTMKDSIDCWWSQKLTNCYECSNNGNLYKCYYCYNSEDMSECIFCDECYGCKNCIMCYGLSNKSYCIKNQQYSEEEFEKEKARIFESYESLEKAKIEAHEFFDSNYHKYMSSFNVENSKGDYIYSSRDTLGYNVVSVDNWKYLYECGRVKDAFDCTYVYDCEWKILEWNNILRSYNVLFSRYVSEWSSNVLYSMDLINCKDCFGCSWLKNKENCIFNKQYTNREYEELVSKIIEHMKFTTWERWEFFPIEISTFGYNETIAQEYYPMDMDTALSKWYRWQPKEYPINIPQGISTIKAEELAQRISDIEDSIVNIAIVCKDTGKLFRLTKSELEFYRKHNIPIPRKSPDIRHMDRMNLRNPRKLYNRKCFKCWVDILSTYSPNSNIKILCEKCYNEKN